MLDRVFHAFSDATRRDIVTHLFSGQESSVSTLAARYKMSFAAVQKHIAVLEQAELVTKRALGRERLVRGNPKQLAKTRAVLQQIEMLWTERFSQLDAVLADPRTPRK